MTVELSSDVVRGFSDLMILYELLDEPSYGYEISKRIKNLSQERFVMKETTLYSAFKRLEQNGYLESFSGKETSGKKRTYYRITDEGKTYYEDKCKEWELTKLIIENFIRR
ncbi:MAG: PadR family transcriptional regulator [Tissierellia bacterium]|nr:PadR family transcriptional regulator [Tissierellia bacterium]